MHLHVEFLIMEAVLKLSPERMLAEIVDNIYCMSKQDTCMPWQAFYITWKQTVPVGRRFVILFRAGFVVTLCKWIKLTMRLFFC